MNRLLYYCLLLITSLTAQAQTRVFDTEADTIPYRIPALAVTADGRLLAVADYRYCRQDIGFGAVDLHYRMSHDNGKTWGEELTLADGTGVGTENVWNYAFGDAAIIADRERSGEVLCISVAGKSPYPWSTRANPNRAARFRSHDGGATWTAGEEMTHEFYELLPSVEGLFLSSGRICQSRQTKVGDYYRLYGALCTRRGVFVVFSDDFGQSWQLLGSADASPCPLGDESKVEELPDGSIVLSSRTEGRWLNVFHFTDVRQAEGHWDTPRQAPAFCDIGNACNGEILSISAVEEATKCPVTLLLQTVPFGPQRSHVGFFYKVLRTPADWQTSEVLASDWHRGLQVSQRTSAYSTMQQLPNQQIALLWEEGPQEYNICFQRFTIDDITTGKYCAVDAMVR